jgi:hypothetical protein
MIVSLSEIRFFGLGASTQQTPEFRLWRRQFAAFFVKSVRPAAQSQATTPIL